MYVLNGLNTRKYITGKRITVSMPASRRAKFSMDKGGNMDRMRWTRAPDAKIEAMMTIRRVTGSTRLRTEDLVFSLMLPTHTPYRENVPCFSHPQRITQDVLLYQKELNPFPQHNPFRGNFSTWKAFLSYPPLRPRSGGQGGTPCNTRGEPLGVLLPF
jgi:hypothetical protein